MQDAVRVRTADASPKLEKISSREQPNSRNSNTQNGNNYQDSNQIKKQGEKDARISFSQLSAHKLAHEKEEDDMPNTDLDETEGNPGVFLFLLSFSFISYFFLFFRFVSLSPFLLFFKFLLSFLFFYY